MGEQERTLREEEEQRSAQIQKKQADNLKMRDHICEEAASLRDHIEWQREDWRAECEMQQEALDSLKKQRHYEEEQLAKIFEEEHAQHRNTLAFDEAMHHEKRYFESRQREEQLRSEGQKQLEDEQMQEENRRCQVQKLAGLSMTLSKAKASILAAEEKLRGTKNHYQEAGRMFREQTDSE